MFYYVGLVGALQQISHGIQTANLHISLESSHEHEAALLVLTVNLKTLCTVLTFWEFSIAAACMFDYSNLRTIVIIVNVI